MQLREDVSRDRRAQLEVALDDIVCEECPICGELMIESIDEPFISEDDQSDYVKAWTLQ